MSREPKEWIKGRRRSPTGGIHVYINGDRLHEALDSAGIDLDADLKVRVYSLRNRGAKGTAEVLMKIKEVK